MNREAAHLEDTARSADARAAKAAALSVALPAKDEETSIPILVEQLVRVSRNAGLKLADVVVVDDGSADGAWRAVEALAKQYGELRGIRLRRNFGKSTALMVGVEAASGDIIVTTSAFWRNSSSAVRRGRPASRTPS